MIKEIEAVKGVSSAKAATIKAAAEKMSPMGFTTGELCHNA